MLAGNIEDFRLIWTLTPPIYVLLIQNRYTPVLYPGTDSTTGTRSIVQFNHINSIVNDSYTCTC